MFNPHVSSGHGLTFRLICAWALICCAFGTPAAAISPEIVHLKSEVNGGASANNVIWVKYYRAAGKEGRFPAVVIVHSLADSEGSISYRFLMQLSEQLSQRGITCALMTLPYHMQRSVDREPYIQHFAGPDVGADVLALRQSASDVSTTISWLEAQPNVNSSQIGAIGLSIGAIVVHLAMGQDARISAGVAMLGGGDLQSLYNSSLPIRLFGGYSPKLLTPDIAKSLRTVDPNTYDTFHIPRPVLMIAAARDLYVPPANALSLWLALQKPRIIWIDTNHFAILSAESAVRDVTFAYLVGVWRADNPEKISLPSLSVPTIKVGFVFGSAGPLSPAVQWQWHSFANRPDHISAIHSDLGVTSSGAFLSLAATLNSFVDIGLAKSTNRSGVSPYISMHLVL